MKERLSGFVACIRALHVSPEGCFELDVEDLKSNVSVNKSLRDGLLLLGRKEKHIPKLTRIEESVALEQIERIIYATTNSARSHELAGAFLGLVKTDIHKHEFHTHYDDSEPEHALYIIIDSEKQRAMINMFFTYD